MRFKLLSGYHRQGREGETFGKGEIVESDHNLVKDYPNKFRALDDDSPGKKSSLKEKLKKGKKNKLREKLAGKKKAKGNLGSLIDKKRGGLTGKDVTRRFPSALKKSLRVIKDFKTGKFSIVREKDPATPLNEKPLMRLKVEKFIDGVFGEETDLDEE